jgi:hypothetical protein
MMQHDRRRRLSATIPASTSLAARAVLAMLAMLGPLAALQALQAQSSLALQAGVRRSSAAATASTAGDTASFDAFRAPHVGTVAADSAIGFPRNDSPR